MFKAAAFAAALALSGVASADIIEFSIYENADNADTSDLSFTVELADVGGSAIDFTFRNASTGGSFISAVYFENNHLIAGGGIQDESAGVDFSDGASPANPAQHPSNFGGPWGGNEYASDADSPSPTNGINETGNEHLTVRFSYDNGAAYGDVLHALTNDPADFRIALHIQGIGPNGQYSVWGTTVPAPASAALLGLAGLAATRRRR